METQDVINIINNLLIKKGIDLNDSTPSTIDEAFEQLLLNSNIIDLIFVESVPIEIPSLFNAANEREIPQCFFLDLLENLNLNQQKQLFEHYIDDNISIGSLVKKIPESEYSEKIKTIFSQTRSKPHKETKPIIYQHLENLKTLAIHSTTSNML
ncbi:hypothetical protein L3V86_00235 [Thiotrichales bacterium 19S11-10]|nr:hypothetical protein [Thiotrichales bacterium 19S11-10]